ncbi:hypothetical protein [Sphingomonas quercus]|uniref:Nucleoside 2-deoxyribosyltransferase n=1 Tax=Sphingomonas quercus TaxID=2842451 RepID=A0ABS6BKM2_9SPHN|nr:hypothetical protein [Sphingomonas quercus]MBU3078857.1 hypothetical protein [Sphingomonas quercus]
MSDRANACAICEGAAGAVCTTFQVSGKDALGFACEACGEYEVARTALVNWFGGTRRLDARERAALAHRVRITDRSSGRPLVTTFWLDQFVPTARVPSPALQAANLIRVVGDHVSHTGEGYFIDGVRDATLIGSFNQMMFDQLIRELTERKVLINAGSATIPNPRGPGVLSGRLHGLSLDGWERYEAEQRGKMAGKYGFMAMKFGDVELDAFSERVIKPEVESAIGYTVVDLRNVSRAGVIDNLMREQIRDAAFVLVDLTHDNFGAYWEAGYAEGLGKPVIYLCERTKFERARTHFDTNHCTTVLWSISEEDQFRRELVATLRRSLNLFAKETD